MKTYSLPCKAYYDGFSGIIKYIVLEARKNSFDNGVDTHCSSDITLKIRVTEKKNHTYKYGEILETSGLVVFPRVCYDVTRAFTYLVDEYKWDLSQ
jgi:hypothetical protein